MQMNATYTRGKVWLKILVGLLMLNSLLAVKAKCDSEESFSQISVSNDFMTALSEQERAWLNDHPVIRVAQDPGWPPVEFTDDRGQFSGMSEDYLRLVEKRLGVTFNRVPNLSWRNAYERLKRWEIDMTTSVAITPQRTEFWAFTEPYLTIPIVIATQMDVTYIADIRELAGKKVAVVSSYAIDDWLARDFPAIRRIHVKSALDGLERLQRGEVFAYIDNLLIIGYYQAAIMASSIKIAGQTPYVNAQCMAVRKDWAPLAGILQKALASIPETERADIYRKWLPVRYEHGFNYTFFWQALAVFVVILLAVILWNRKLVREIRFRRQAEAEARQSEEKFRLTFRSSPDAVNINRLRDGLYVDINEGFTQLTGYTRDAVAGKTSLDIEIWKDPEDRARLVRELKEHGFCDNLEARFKKKDGSLTTALMSARVISLNDEPHIISITRDITERKIAEAEREQLLVALDQANEIVIITDAAGNIQYVNPAFEKITGFSRLEAIGKHPRMLGIPSHDHTFYEKLWDIILSGDPWAGRIINRRRNGGLYTAECSISPVKDNHGDVVNGVWICHDVTNEIELEKRIAQAQKMEAIGVLAGGIAHDFNNLLFPITGLAEILMEDTPKESRLHENAEQIFKAARRAAELVQQILSFSRQTEHKKTAVRVQQILKEVLKLARATIPKNIDIIKHIQDDCGLVVADPTQIHQIAMNLITNAYHAVEQTGGKITVSLTEIACDTDTMPGTVLEPGKYARLSIADTGYGIPEENMAKIFEPYFTTKAPGKGTGLGLAVVYGIIKEHGGEIQAISEAGKGTTFIIFLPIMQTAALQQSPEIGGISETGTERILLVDDELSIVRLETQMLERLGYRVEERTGSVDALHAFRANPDRFDLVISDLTMPNMTGDQLAREIMAIRPDVPIILCTGFSERLDRERALAMGIKGFLMKPVSRFDMARVIRQVLDEEKNPDSALMPVS